MIAVAGEALIDLVDRDGTLHPLPGGGPFNTAIALGRLGVPTGFLGRLSYDQFGELLVGLLRESGVHDRYVLRGSAPTPETPSTLAPTTR
jgi:fructokinase